MNTGHSLPSHSASHARVRGALLAASMLMAVVVPSPAQTGTSDPSTREALQQLQAEVRELKQLVLQLQQQTADSHSEIRQLRQELQTRRADAVAEPVVVDEQSPASSVAGSANVEQRLAHVEEDQQLLAGKIDEQYQTKVESASKYRIRLSGIVLFNLFGNTGSVDNQDVPTWVLRPDPMGSSGSIGGTMRQSILGFEAFGPEFMGAKSSATVNFDFGGGFPATYNGVNSGIVRLHTAAVRLDWKDTSVIAGQDPLFLSPDAPTSFASLIVPPLSAAGNLWAWTPQLRVEHRWGFSGGSTVTLQGALLDPLTGEPPNDDYFVWTRHPGAGERSRQPAYAARVAYSHPLFAQTFTLGAGGYYSRENWGFDRAVDGWAGTMDANLPLGSKFSLAAEFYRGAGIGGLGAALGRSVLFNGPLSNPATQVLALNTVGGWGQLKLRATPKLEFNGAFGQDNPFAADVRAFGEHSSSYEAFFITRNRAAFGNVIYRPRSDLVLALEYRRLRTFSIYDTNWAAGQVNMSMGVLF